MSRIGPVLACLLFVLGPVAEPAPAAPVAAPTTAVAPIDRLLSQPIAHVGSRDIDTATLRPFYAQRGFQPAWSDPTGSYDLGRLSADIAQVAGEHGLFTDSYALLADQPGAETDVMISDALARLGRDLTQGRIAPYRVIGGMGQSFRPHYDPQAFLKQIQSGKALRDAAHLAAPQSTAYDGLLHALATYRGFAANGGWTTIADGPTVKPGETEPRVAALRARLIASGDFVDNKATGDFVANKATGETLDDDLVLALKRFQARHGLDQDGALGKRTVATLNVPAPARVRQIEMSLERLRQLPRTLEPTRIEVNIASQQLTLYRSGEPSLSMRVVVGNVKHQTPGMVTRVSTITVNPSWTVPASIARKEILPKLKRDPHYLSNNNMRLMDRSPGDSPDVDDTAIDWTRMGSSFPFVLRQRPGPDNALGQLKFNLQDQDAIYMHDTPQKTFFKRSYRALSHGCVRLERPFDLADQLLDPKWTGKLPEVIATTKSKTLGLKLAVAVYLYYQTAWTETDGTVSFRDDIYGADHRLYDALTHVIPLSELLSDERAL